MDVLLISEKPLTQSIQASGSWVDLTDRGDAGRRLADRFDQLDQSAFGSCGRVRMDQLLARGLIECFLGDAELGLSSLGITGFHGIADTTKLRPQAAA